MTAQKRNLETEICNLKSIVSFGAVRTSVPARCLRYAAATGASTSVNREAVADAVHSAAIHLLRGVRKEDVGSVLGSVRLSALSVLVFAGPMRLSDLARIEQVRPPTMTEVVAGLEARGLVKRRGDVDDGRAVRFEATPRGMKVLHEDRRRRVARVTEGLQSLTTDEIDVLGRAAAIIERVSRTI